MCNRIILSVNSVLVGRYKVHLVGEDIKNEHIRYGEVIVVIIEANLVSKCLVQVDPLDVVYNCPNDTLAQIEGSMM
jgi:hypothetical protein